MVSIREQIEEFKDDFASISNELERSEMIEYYANELQPVPQKIATPPYDPAAKVPECVTPTFVYSELIDGKVQFYFAVEEQGLTAKSIAAMFDEIFSGRTPEDILAASEDALKEMGLTLYPNLSLGRQAGLVSFILTIKAHAKNFCEQDNMNSH